MKKISILDSFLLLISSFLLLISCYPDALFKGYYNYIYGIVFALVMPMVLGLILIVLVFFIEWKKGSHTNLFPVLSIVSQAIYLGLYVFLFDATSWRIDFYGFWLALLFFLLIVSISIPFWIRAKKEKNKEKKVLRK